MSANSQRRQQWAEEKLSPSLTALITDLLKQMPEDPKLFMSKWLADRSVGKITSTGGTKDDVGEAAERRSLAARTSRASIVLAGGDTGLAAKCRALGAWGQAHAQLESDSARVPREAFVSTCLANAPQMAPEQREAFEAFANDLFDASTGLMLPAQKADLGKHCFSYGYLLSKEFYADKPEDQLSLVAEGRPVDSLQELREQLDSDWAAVRKDDDGRVTLEAFKEQMVSKHAGQLVPESSANFEASLELDFKSALSMMLPAQKTTLGGHCFRYAGLMAGEFYFDAAKDAATGCGCSAPVADVLNCTK